jgi:diguanylate cyclase (GGDEF)-like protein
MRIFLFFFSVFVFCSKVLALDLNELQAQPLGSYLQVFNSQQQLSPRQAYHLYQQRNFQPHHNKVVSQGIGEEVVWLGLTVESRSKNSLSKYLLVENSWLDKIEIYLFVKGKLLWQAQGGDSFPFAKRQYNQRFHLFEIDFPPGASQLLVALDSIDPLVAPIYLLSAEQLNERNTYQAYSYGALYGVMLALLAFNLLIFYKLRDGGFFSFALYIFSFCLMNIAYTGHGYLWLWPEAVRWQQWANPMLMLVYCFSGLLFARYFLKLPSGFPKIAMALLYFKALFLIAFLYALLTEDQLLALQLAFGCVLLFSVIMVSLGGMSYRGGNRSAGYFLLASLAAIIGSVITALTVLGLIVYSEFGFRAVELGMISDVILLTLALAESYNLNKEQRIKAQQMARTDPLTQLNNRRAFLEMVAPLWETCRRRDDNMAIILIDIDKFKTINDEFGHNSGDIILYEVAQAINRGRRRCDVLSRWGGEEFVLFLPQTSVVDAERVAEKVHQQIALLKLTLAHQQIQVTTSMGIAAVQGRNISLHELIAEADAYLYQAKSAGRNCTYSANSQLQPNSPQEDAVKL